MFLKSGFIENWTKLPPIRNEWAQMMNARKIELFQIKVCLLIKEYCDQTFQGLKRMWWNKWGKIYMKWLTMTNYSEWLNRDGTRKEEGEREHIPL